MIRQPSKVPNKLDYSIENRIVDSVLSEKVEAPVKERRHNRKKCLSAEQNDDDGKQNGSQAVGELVDACLLVTCDFSILSVLYSRV